ncbi:MAG: hypothetical protein GXP33_06530 [Spirochaetes bacterium]|nr:hypothetical protein [Spirochaetota bacterium]
MKYKKMFIILIPVILIIAACPTGTLPGATPGTTPNYSFSVLFNDTAFNTETDTLDFGPVKAGSAGSEVTGTISNDGDTAFSVTAIALGDSASSYSLTIPTLPYTIEPGKTADFSLAFTPESSGVITTKLTISYTADTDKSVEINITGEGNYAPVAQFGIDVSDSTAYSQVEGFYVKDGGSHNLRPTYKKSGATDYYIYFLNPDGSFWGIGTYPFDDRYPYFGEGTDGPLCYIGVLSSANYYYPPEHELASGLNWVENYTNTPVITVKTGITRALGSDVLTANYHYSDSEGDAESGTSYQWYRSDTAEGTYTEITVATAKQYTIDPNKDYDKYIKVKVTPADDKGIAGDAVTSDPYYVEPPQSQP